ncbi:MAG: MarR family winged helix-turn-helix transcriptional regulator [Streptococcaceae bacterium]|jgi:DNA-binding MarR family transcriptional regulator|nr:MarR family winged helix-turn-helix transcriptional regulator [Streptococcaceae bacterium]
MDFSKAASDLMQIVKQATKSEEVQHLNKVGRGEIPILVYLKHHETDDVTPSDLAEDGQISSARVATLLAGLEDHGLVKREIDKHDRRKIIVKLTGKGRTKLNQQREIMEGRVQKTLEAMGERDTQDFLRTFQKFLDTLKEVNECQN